MTHQKSEDRVVPEGRGNPVPPRRGRTQGGGGKAVSVKEEERQLTLFVATAENPRRRGAARRNDVDQSTSRTRVAPKAMTKRGEAVPAVMEEVVERLWWAFQKVAANKGAPGPDRQTIEQVEAHLHELLPKLKTALLDGSYRPGEIRRVWIAKAGGGERGLGIPNVVDRMVQEAMRQVLEPQWEPTFHPSSHGFRPNRSCHTAIAEARRYVGEGYEWVVDLDMEKFFDRVNHQRLMSALAQRVKDRRLLSLVGRMLRAEVVMPDGVKVSTDEGVPQGGPLSPLLSNIVLSELDEELARRGLKFVRYADDCNIYVRSERAGERVMASVKRFVEKRLRLRINESKSAVARPETRHFLGYRLQPVEEGLPEVLLSERSRKRLDARVVELTPRAGGRSLKAIIRGLERYLRGWLGHFGVCTSGVLFDIRCVDAHVRRRLRAAVLKHWKRRRTIARRLVSLGAKRKSAWSAVYAGSKSTWKLSHENVVERALSRMFFERHGLSTLQERFEELWAERTAPVQMDLLLGTERS
jgi:group II intron reverse transcriptase/maturase